MWLLGGLCLRLLLTPGGLFSLLSLIVSCQLWNVRFCLVPSDRASAFLLCLNTQSCLFLRERLGLNSQNTFLNKNSFFVGNFRCVWPHDFLLAQCANSVDYCAGAGERKEVTLFILKLYFRMMSRMSGWYYLLISAVLSAVELPLWESARRWDMIIVLNLLNAG